MRLIIPLLFLCAVLKAQVTPEAALARSRPNFLFIAIDDMNDFAGYASEEPGNFLQTIYPDPVVRASVAKRLTPNIDKLAAHAAPFVRSYCASPLCGPSRTALLSGVATHNSGYYSHERHFRLYDTLKDVITLPQQLKAHGYHTAGLGKIFHKPEGTVDGALKDDWADARFSWSQWVNSPSGCNGGQPSKYSPPDGGLMSFGPSRLKLEEAGDWQTASFAAQVLASGKAAMAFKSRKGEAAEQSIELPNDKPFFLGCGIFRPHLPFHAPKEFFNKFPTEEMAGLNRATLDAIVADLKDIPADGMRFSDYQRGKFKEVMDHSRKIGGSEGEIAGWREMVQAYLSCIAFADACVGRILQGLDASPARDNTVVMLWSDHGFHVGNKYHVAKQALWEESNRTQLIIRDPRSRSARDGHLRRQIVSLTDLYPTVCAMARVPMPATALIGKDLAPLLADAGAPEIHEVVLQTYMPQNHSLRTPAYRLTRYNEGGLELFDMLNDPQQLNNLAKSSDLDAVRKDLTRRLDKMVKGEVIPPKSTGKKNADQMLE